MREADHLREQADEWRERAERAEARVAAALAILDGDEGFVVAEAQRPDGRRSKLDRCPHGEFRYSGCATCLDEALRAAFAAPDDGQPVGEAAADAP